MNSQWRETQARPSWRKIVRSLLAVVAVGTVVATLAACSTSSGATSGSSGSGKGTIGLIFNSAADPNQQAIYAGLKKVAIPDGYTITTVDAKADAAAANDLMNTMVTRQVKAIVFITFDPTSLTSGIAAANAAKIPVYAIGSGYGHPKGLTGATRQDAGALETQAMVNAMGGNSSGAGTGSVLAFTYRAGAPCAVAETRFDSVMKKHAAIKVTKADVNNPSSAQFGEATADAWLRSHPVGQGPYAIWACYDGPNIGALVSLKSAGRTDVKVYGAYGQAEAIEAVKAGTYTATWYYDLESDGERVAADINSGKYSLSNPDLYQTKTVEVNAKTVDAFIKEFPAAVKPAS